MACLPQHETTFSFCGEDRHTALGLPPPPSQAPEVAGKLPILKKKEIYVISFLKMFCCGNWHTRFPQQISYFNFLCRFVFSHLLTDAHSYTQIEKFCTHTSTNHKFGRTVCNFANFGRTNMIQVGIPLVSLFLIVSLLWIFLQVSFW